MEVLICIFFSSSCSKSVVWYDLRPGLNYNLEVRCASSNNETDTIRLKAEPETVSLSFSKKKKVGIKGECDRISGVGCPRPAVHGREPEPGGQGAARTGGGPGQTSRRELKDQAGIDRPPIPTNIASVLFS